ncbi:hypothetical protein PTKIN_Ptkin07bG0281200 [Pterospermum kingtungense]
MERFPEKVSAAVFVSASMPGPDLTYISLSQEAVLEPINARDRTKDKIRLGIVGDGEEREALCASTWSLSWSMVLVQGGNTAEINRPQVHLPPEERVILVGHSRGGYSISAAMEKFPQKVAVGVFATAFMPGPNLTLQTPTQQFNERLDSDKYMDSQFGFHKGVDKPATSILLGPNFMASKLYQLSPPEDLTLALTLARHAGIYNDEGSIKATAVTEEKYGLVHRVYIVCDKDQMIKEDFQRWTIENNPPDEVKLIPDSDHMVMFSKPNELCSCLQEIAEQYI